MNIKSLQRAQQMDKYIINKQKYHKRVHYGHNKLKKKNKFQSAIFTLCYMLTDIVLVSPTKKSNILKRHTMGTPN